MPAAPLPPSPWEFRPDLWPRSDCVAAGADLEPSTVVEAYRHGAFPMPDEGDLLWWSPVERGVLEPSALRVSRSLRQAVRRLTVTIDTAFAEVVDACADPSRPGAWIDHGIRDAYVRLHELGWAHSVETRDADGTLVGGLYGLSVGRLFAGESMFHHARDASKVALVALVDAVGPEGLVDVQWATPHLESLGVVQWPRERYLGALHGLVDAPGPDWDALRGPISRAEGTP
ncbi:leucyl/phenylalanyl-tRNA--protein transferase [Aeromicrobium sp.]|uniref:leucyl/phenylalanyl-tRNA--protein transferase n=1 Tax=Aeromicrobium sp. TaxID=1871063 RepID=UPI0035145D32